MLGTRNEPVWKRTRFFSCRTSILVMHFVHRSIPYNIEILGRGIQKSFLIQQKLGQAKLFS